MRFIGAGRRMRPCPTERATDRQSPPKEPTAMLPTFDTYATALTIDRALVLKRAERRARLLETSSGPTATGPTIVRAATTASRGSLSRAFGSLLAVLRLSQA